MAAIVGLWVAGLVFGFTFSAFWLCKAALLYKPDLAQLPQHLVANLFNCAGRTSERSEIKAAHSTAAFDHQTSVRNFHDGVSIDMQRLRGQLGHDSARATQPAFVGMPPCTLLFRDLTSIVIRPKRRVVLHSVSATAFPFEMLAILGPSGAGKSTLLDILASRKSPGTEVGGVVLLNGHRHRAHVEKVVNYIPQDTHFVPTMTARETVAFYAAMKLPLSSTAAERRDQVQRALAQMGLEAQTNTLVGGMLPGGLPVPGMSGGERKRLGIAAGLVAGQPVVVLDEPTTGLDSFAALVVVQYLRQLAAEGHTLLATLHQPRAAIWNLLDKVLVLSQGRMVYWGPCSALTPWVCGHLGTTYDPRVDGVASDWIMDLVTGEGSDITARLLALEAAAKRELLTSMETPNGVSDGCVAQTRRLAVIGPPSDPAAATQPSITSSQALEMQHLGPAGGARAYRASSIPGDARLGAGAPEGTAGWEGAEGRRASSTHAREDAVVLGAVLPNSASGGGGGGTSAAGTGGSGPETPESQGFNASDASAARTSGPPAASAAPACRTAGAVTGNLAAGTSCPPTSSGVSPHHHAGEALTPVMTSAIPRREEEASAEAWRGEEASAAAPPQVSERVGHGGEASALSPGSLSDPAVGASPEGQRTAGSMRSPVDALQDVDALTAGAGAGAVVRRWLRCYRGLLWREYLAVSRNPGDTAGRMLLFVIMATLSSLLNYGLPPTAEALQRRMHAMFLAHSFYLLIPFVFMTFFTADKQLYVADVSERGLYPPSAYFFAKLSCASIPLNALVAFPHAVIVYGMLGLRPSGGAAVQNFSLSVLLAVVALMVMQLCAVVSVNQDVAFMLAVAWTSVNLLVSNFFQPYSLMTVPRVSGLRYVSASSAAWEGVIGAELRHRTFNCSSGMGTAVLGLSPDFLPSSPGHLFSNPLLLRTIRNPGQDCIADSDVILSYYDIHQGYAPKLGYMLGYIGVVALLTYLGLLRLARRSRLH